MAFVKEALLQQALFTHLATLTTTPATTIVYPSDPDTGPSRPYLQVDHLPNTARQETLDPSTDLPGFLIVTVVSDEGVGTLQAQNIGAQVAAHFPTTLRLFTDDYRIRFTQPATVGQSRLDDGELRTNVSIPYLANT